MSYSRLCSGYVRMTECQWEFNINDDILNSWMLWGSSWYSGTIRYFKAAIKEDWPIPIFDEQQIKMIFKQICLTKNADKVKKQTCMQKFGGWWLNRKATLFQKSKLETRNYTYRFRTLSSKKEGNRARQGEAILLVHKLLAPPPFWCCLAWALNLNFVGFNVHEPTRTNTFCNLG